MSDEKLNDSLLEIIGRLQGRNQALQKGHATLTRRVQELEAELGKAKHHVLSCSETPFAVAGDQVFISGAFISDKAYDSEVGLQVPTGVMHVKDEGFISSKSCPSTPATTPADTALQADIEYLRQRVNELENAHRFSFGAGKGTSNGMAVFQETVNRGIEQALRNAVSPGGILYGKLK